jgi:hypothetical protein
MVLIDNIISLKDKIEKLEKHHQIEILRILKQEKNITLNENNNGIFINISEINDQLFNNLNEYINYVENQKDNIDSVESKKTILENTFFKNKDKL